MQEDPDMAKNPSQACPQPCKWKIELSVIFENTNLTAELPDAIS